MEPFVGFVCYSTFSFIYYDLTLLSQIEPSSYLTSFQQNPSKTISSPSKPEGNATHRVYYAVSPEITLWVTGNTQVFASWE
jgi:hypothetical protein